MDGASVVWVALMVFLYVEPSLGSRQLPKRATSPPSWLMQSTIVGKANRRSLCYFSGFTVLFFLPVYPQNLLFAPCCQNWHIYINTLYIRWRGGGHTGQVGDHTTCSQNKHVGEFLYFKLPKLLVQLSEVDCYKRCDQIRFGYRCTVYKLVKTLHWIHLHCIIID